MGLRPGDGRDQIGRLHPQTGKVLATVPVPASVCMGMDVGYGSLWAASCAPATISRINPRTAKVEARIPIDVASLAPESDQLAVRIDPATNKVSARYGPLS